MAETAKGSGSSINPLDAVGVGVQAFTAIAGTIAGISDMNKKREFEQAMGLLSNAQQKELNEKLLKANTQNERLQLLSTAVLQFAINAQASQDKTNNVMLIIAGSIGIVLVIGAIIYAVKTRK